MEYTSKAIGPARIQVLTSDAKESSILKNILLGQGYEVIISESPPDPVDSIRQERPVLVIIQDNNNSFPIVEICKQLQTDENIALIPALIVSSQTVILHSLSGLPEIVDFLRFPFEREELIVHVKNLLHIGNLEFDNKQLRLQLMQAQRLECIGALAAGIAHEFNNLMFSVMGFAEIAQSGDKDKPDIEALRESASISYEVARRAAAIAGSLLAFTRKSESKKTRGNINDAISAAVRLLKKDLENNGIKIELNLGDLPETIFALGPIQQVLLNLLLNSWHSIMARNMEKRITVTSSCENGMKIKVTVEDTGTGVPKELQKKIFEPFFTTKNAGKTQGTGLGLTIVQKVMADHSGLVRLESEEGKGAKFILWIPVETEEKSDGARFQPTNADQAATLINRKYSVLIIDDEEHSRRLIARMLIKYGHEAWLASNMAEALNLFWAHSINLIIMDMIMPGEDGVSNIKNLRNEGIETPILICTGHLDSEAIQKGIEAGASACIMKPFSTMEFLLSMNACLVNARPKDNPDSSK